MAKRKALSTKLRFDVFKRDGFACQYCGATPPQAVLWVDHITPVCDGGGNEIDNLITSCDRCNLGKGGTPLTTVPKSLAERAAETAEREAQIRGYSEVMAARRTRIEDDAWQIVAVFAGEGGNPNRIRKDWFQSIKRFIERLGIHECLDAMEIAVARLGTRREDDIFKYFCGICWSKVREVEGE